MRRGDDIRLTLPGAGFFVATIEVPVNPDLVYEGRLVIEKAMVEKGR